MENVYFCGMRLKLRARIRLHRIVMAWIKKQDEEWTAFMEQLHNSRRQGDDEGCACDQEGYNADPKARRRPFGRKKFSCITAGGPK